ncbi:hypothetical protein [Nocardioides panzhihuensis]|uniref:Uncharacterized protein n=1 Tax=Nocardioides panzhihuensis TaxID=860243 RepID=A0A7Z0DT21_9ACTN|nr:hypothetical protein [Nocardioides panzhihuensis]NYI81254.1 hypothetical protein [Nocardioides panzhihuensis]
MPADPDLMEEIYAFARARAVERTQRKGMDLQARQFATSDLRYLQTAYAKTKWDGTNAAISAAIDVFRKAAMRDSDHPDYDPIWTLPEK